MMHVKPFKTGSNRGFTLLEVIVALVLVATTGMALFSWINSSLDTMSRVMEKNNSILAARNALAWIRTVNPMLKQNGTIYDGDLEISWHSVPVAPTRMGSGHLGGTSLYQLGLYDTDVKVVKQGRIIYSFTVRQAGFRQVHPFLIETGGK